MKPKKSAWTKAEEFGIDTSLLRSSLKKTPTERVQTLQNALLLANALQKAGTNYYAKLRKTSKTTVRS